MRKALFLKKDHVPWSHLHGKIVKNEVVVLDNYVAGSQVVTPVFQCKKLFLDCCEKNFVYFFANKKYFPNVTDLYLGSHPCEPEVLWRKFDNIYLLDNYSRYKKRWAENSTNVKIISNQDFINEMADHQPEDIILGKTMDV